MVVKQICSTNRTLKRGRPGEEGGRSEEGKGNEKKKQRGTKPRERTTTQKNTTKERKTAALGLAWENTCTKSVIGFIAGIR
ncbi:hypothetical protein LSPH26S_04158 [Lysinibacillus sphaericus]